MATARIGGPESADRPLRCCWQVTNELSLVGDVWGRDEAPVVLLLHGGGQTRHAWGGTASALAAGGWRAIALDLRGHGESSWAPDGDYSLDTLASDVESVLASIGSPAVVVGASLGGLTSLTLLERGHIPCRALVLVDVTPRLEPAGTQRIGEFMRARPDGFASLEEVADAVAAYSPHRPRPSDLSGLAKNVRLGPDGRYRWHWDPNLLGGNGPGRKGLEIRHDRLLEAARSLVLPVLLVRGKMSDIVSEESVAEFLSAVPHARYIDVADAAHMVAGDQNDAFTTAVSEFLRDLDSTSGAAPG